MKKITSLDDELELDLAECRLGGRLNEEVLILIQSHSAFVFKGKQNYLQLENLLAEGVFNFLIFFNRRLLVKLLK